MKLVEKWLALCGLAVLLSGCGSFRLYDKSADDAATSAKADYDASKVSEALRGERGMLDGLEVKELDAFRRATQAQRDLDLMSLLSESGTSAPRTTSNGLVSRFHALSDERLAGLTGPATDPVHTLSNLDRAKRTLRDAEIREKNARVQLAAFHPKLAAIPGCNKDVAGLKDKSTADDAAALIKDPSFVPKNLPASKTWQSMILALGQRCDELISARTALKESLAGVKTGQVSRAIAAAKEQEDGVSKKQQDAKAAASELTTAASKLAAAQAAVKDAGAAVDLTCDLSKPVPKGGTSDIERRRNDLCAALTKLNDLGDFGVKVISEERLARINSVLAAMSGMAPAAGDPPLEPSLALLSASSRLAHSLKIYRVSKNLPALEPLLIERQLAAAQLAYAQAGIDLAKDRMRYAQEYRDASFREVDLLTQANSELGGLGPRPPDNMDCKKVEPKFCASMSQFQSDKAFAGIDSGGGESAKRRAYRAMALLAESHSVARDQQRTAEVKLINTDYRESLLRSEASVASWDALISVPIGLLQKLAKQGWTAMEIAQLFQSFGVLGIASRL